MTDPAPKRNAHNSTPGTPGTPRTPQGISDYVPAKLNGADWDALEPLYTGLLERTVGTLGEFEQWLLDRSELDAAASEGRANLYINMTCHTDDKAASAAWTTYLDKVSPNLKPMSSKLDRRQLELFEAFSDEPGVKALHTIERSTRRSIDIFRQENVDIETKIAKLDQKYDELCGEMSVEFDGQERTLPQMGKYLQESDRDRREKAWRLTAERRLRDRDAIEAIFEEMIELRQQLATNAGYDNYRDYQHDKYQRFDYTPQDCKKFHAAITQHCVPFMRKLDERRRKSLGLDTLRPWDLAVDEKGRDPLTPFDGGQDLIERSRKVFQGLDPELAGFFNSLGDDVTVEGGGQNFDLNSRKGKAFGGYQYMRDRARVPFIFMNAAGLHRDVETMVHEAGHAFHSMLCAHHDLLPFRDYCTEIAETASMSMELLTMPYWDAYYPDALDADRARRAQLEGSISTLCWIATIDEYQHWIYTNKGHTRAQREAAWVDIMSKYDHATSWEGLEDFRAAQWQRQGHLFGNPFYYIEYGIAQLASLGIWRHMLNKGEAKALELYKAALAPGGSKPLPELFALAELPFDFGPEIVGTLVAAVEAELAKLPE